MQDRRATDSRWRLKGMMYDAETSELEISRRDGRPCLDPCGARSSDRAEKPDGDMANPCSRLQTKLDYRPNRIPRAAHQPDDDDRRMIPDITNLIFRADPARHRKRAGTAGYASIIVNTDSRSRPGRTASGRAPGPRRRRDPSRGHTANDCLRWSGPPRKACPLSPSTARSRELVDPISSSMTRIPAVLPDASKAPDGASGTRGSPSISRFPAGPVHRPTPPRRLPGYGP